MSSLPTLLNLRPPINDVMLGQSGTPAPLWQMYFTNLNRQLLDLAGFDVADYGARGNGIVDDTQAVQSTIDAVVANNGGIVVFDAGTFSINSVSTPTGSIPIVFQGRGDASVLKRNGDITPGKGMIDINGSLVEMTTLMLDGNQPVAQKLLYGVNFVTANGNDPMAPSLTNNTTVWLHGGISEIWFERVTWTHAAGYSLLLDATKSDINAVTVNNSTFINNRASLFGTSATDINYGSWNGGILAKGDGTTATSSVVDGLQVTFCKFFRNTGNCLWSHLYGLNNLHSDFTFVGNYFEDCGLDGILVGGVTGGVVGLNIFHRIGYVCTDDTSQSTPRWLVNLNATALDSAGIVKGVPYISNTFYSINGGCMDLDGHGDSIINGNVCRIPYPGEPEYVEDQIAKTGPANNGVGTCYGINFGNTSDTTYGSAYVNITGNTFINLAAGSIRMYGARYCMAKSNLVISPDAPTAPPIAFGPISSNANQRCYGNKICNNTIYYSPAMGAPAIYEDDTLSNFLGTESNYVYDNYPLGTTGLAFEFQKSTHSGSFVSAFFPPTLNFIATENGTNGAIACPAGSGAKLTVGLTVTILLAHTLTGGAGNTLAYNGGAALAIMSHLNPANNIANSYSVGGLLTVQYDGTQWQDLSQ